jgi:signal transduction histidine kinase
MEGYDLTRDSLRDRKLMNALLVELRKPTNSIVSYTDLLLGESTGILGEMQRSFIERIQASSKRLVGLLSDLYQITPSNVGITEISTSEVDFLACVQEAANMCGPAIQDKNIILDRALPDELTPLIGDEDSYTQIAYHLLNNAIGASPREAKVSFSLREEQFGEHGYAILSVSDQGIGIAPEDLSRIFLTNTQEKPSKVEGLANDGLSVSILKALTESHKGRVWIESEPGEGTTISVLLPLAV